MMRYAIYAAVSTEIQAAPDKISLPDQEERCKKIADGKGWMDTSLRYVVEGESRTRWVNLRDAENEIPALYKLLEDAKKGMFELLIMYDYNRLRDLLDPVAKTLSYYGVQLFSINQPVEPLPPEDYSPYISDSSMMMQGMSKIISQAMISDLRRKYRTAMPRRVTDRGLPIHIPWSYSKPPGRETDRSAVPVPDMDKARVLIAAKDALLSGQSLSQVVEIFEASGYPPPNGGKKWWNQSVRGLLVNPFYAGIVRFGVTQAKLDPRTGTRYRDRKHPHKAVSGKGKHQPLWNEDTYNMIVTTLKERGKNYRGRKNNQLTGLLKCGECNAPMWLFYNGGWQEGARPENRIWRCSSREPHYTIMHDEAVRIVGEMVAKSILEHLSGDVQISGDVIDTKELAAQRARLETAYQQGLLSLDSFSARVAELDALERKQADVEGQRRGQQARLDLLRGIADKVWVFPQILFEVDPVEVNKILRTILEKVVVGETIQLFYKQ